MTNIIVKRPIITEKSLDDANHGVYTFEVAIWANKPEIKNRIEEMFKVHVKNISTVIIHGKHKIVGKKRQVIKENDVKKAKIKLKTGEKIELFEVNPTA